MFVKPLSSLAGWMALAGSAAVSSTTANAAVLENHRAGVDRAGSPGTVRARFELVPSHDGRRTVILDEDSGRRTPVGEVAAGVACEVTVDPEDDPGRALHLTCGSGLEVMVVPYEGSLAIRGNEGFAGTGPRFSDDLPLPAGTPIEPDAWLDDPAPPPACEGTPEVRVDLSLERVLGDRGVPESEEARLSAMSLPIQASIGVAVCDMTCIGKADAESQHYEYVCLCDGEPHGTSIEVHVQDRVVYVVESNGAPCEGDREVKGVWNVPCGASLQYPAGTQVLKYERGYFVEAPEELRARPPLRGLFSKDKKHDLIKEQSNGK